MSFPDRIPDPLHAADARWGGERTPGKTPCATHMGELSIGTAALACAVLDDGRRVLTQEGFLVAIGRSPRPDGTQKTTLENLPPFLVSKNLEAFIPEELRRSSRPIEFRPLRGGAGGKAWGYSATLLPEVCKVYLDARDAGALLPAQKQVARTCDLLIRGLATVGIIALVDEATGYQAERDRDELQAILAQYISAELLPWTRTFPTTSTERCSASADGSSTGQQLKALDTQAS